MTNPYTVPIAEDAADRTRPGFQAIPRPSLKWRLILVIVLTPYLQTFADITPHQGPPFEVVLWCYAGIVSLIMGSYFPALRRKQAIGRHPLVTNGSALAGGAAVDSRSGQRGYLLLTRDKMIFQARDEAWNPDGGLHFPLSEVESVERDSWHGFPRSSIRLGFASGAERHFAVKKPRVWITAIASVRDERNGEPQD